MFEGTVIRQQTEEGDESGASPAIENRQDVRAVVPRGQNDPSLWWPQIVGVMETVQSVHSVGDMGDAIALE